jgi:hypothetical protein
VKLIPLMLVAALGVAASGCTVRGGAYATTPVPAARVEVYEPMYYDGYVVYYDDHGAPYYYVGDTVTYVPRTHASFNVYVGHYHKHRASYRHWYRVEGPRHRHVHRRPDHRPQRPQVRPHHRRR